MATEPDSASAASLDSFDPAFARRRWSLIGPILTKEWEGQWVVYNDATGNTHRISSDAHEVLACLVDGAASGAGLFDRLGLEADMESVVAVSVVLQALERLDLVESVTG